MSIEFCSKMFGEMNMTEATRIKNEGWLPDDFFEPEVRCDYYISSEMKKIWAVLLDLYRKFSEICKKNQLEYFAAAGTVLGAVRHKGMIPWDDDIDVVMPRASYDRLKSLAQEFKGQYFLQNSDTDPEYGFSFMRLCNSNTTIVTKPLQYANYNHGIYLDIFPLDRASDDDIEIRRNQIYELIMKNTAYMRLKNPSKSDSDIERINKYYDPNMKPTDVFHEIERIASLREDDETATYLTSLVSTISSIEKTKKPKEAYSAYIDVPFEGGTTMRLPIGYEEVLKVQYGDYMKFPPIEKRGTWHSGEYYPDIPYQIYYKETFSL